MKATQGNNQRKDKTMKQKICTIIGMFGGAVASLLGGWSAALQYLVIAMITDYISGLVVAGVFHASKKSQHGGLESRAGWKGLCRKVFTLAFVVVARGVDVYLSIDYVKDAVIIGFFTNEVISIVENAGLMGIPMPPIITKAIDLLTTKASGSDEKKEE